MGIFGDIFGDIYDEVADVVSTVAEPVTDLARDTADALGLDTKVDLVEIAVMAAFLGVEIALVKAALGAGCGTVGDVKDWVGGTSGGGGASI